MARLLRIGIWPVLVAALLSLHLFPGQVNRLYAIFMMTATTGGAVLHAVAAWRSTGRGRRVWSITAACLACWAYAEVTTGIPAVLTGNKGHYSLAGNILTLGALVFGVVAMLTIPAAPPTTLGKLRMLFDGLCAATGLLGIAWLVALRPLTQTEELSRAVFDLSYPIVATGVLAVGLVLLAGQPWRYTVMTAITGSIVVLTFVLIVEVAADLAGAVWLQPYVLSGYVIATVLMALACRAPMPAAAERVWRPSTIVGNTLPFLPILIYLPIAVVRVVTGQSFDPVAVLIALMTFLTVCARQFVELRINARLTRELAAERSRIAVEASHDQLTGLPNRAALTAALAAPGPAALLLIDLDGFKAVNDSLGHVAGDELLTVVAARLRAATAIAPGALPARLGGDEFAVLLGGGALAGAEELAQVVLAALSEPIRLGGFPAAIGASIGVAAGLDGADRLLHEADLALYDAKHQGKGTVRTFDRVLSAQVEERRQVQAELALALGDGQLSVVYQPIVDLRTGTSHAAEALVRWEHPVRGLLGPDTFLPAAQDAGLIAEIDRWVLATAVAQLAAWRSADPAYTVAVNLSVAYLGSGRVVEDVAAALGRHGLPGRALTVEVTESSLISDLEAAARTLADLRALGVRVALDDFGVGYSSLTYLRTLPVDVVKIDRSFVREIGVDPQAAIMVEAVLGLVRGLGLDAVAEGVEHPEQAAMLRAMHCARAQGYLFSRPVPAHEVLREAAAL